jgi:membrane protein insertase Oxa1/YidC/SpoIIIJ
LATQAWEAAHAASGLPWWLSIPVTAVALRAALLPLTLKAKGAAVNFALMRRAAETAGAALRREEEEKEVQRRAKEEPTTTTTTAPPTTATRFALARRYYALLRRQHGTPSMWWYNLNVLAQVNVFVSMSAALRQMAGAAWPGLSSEGALWFPDLTAPSVVVGTGWVTPLGVAGLFLPLGVLAAYMATVDRAAPATHSRAARATLELAALPVFLAALVVPQATLLYWLPSSAFQLLTQRGLDANPRLAAKLGVPLLAMRRDGGGKQTEEELRQLAAERGRALVEGVARGGGGGGGDTNGDAEFLRFLAADRLARDDVPGALLALERLTSAVAPRDAEAWRARGALSARLGRWPEAAKAFERAIGEAGSGVGGDNADSARLRRALLVRAGTAHLNAISVAGGSAAGSAGSPQAAAAALSAEQRRHLDAALAALNRATAAAEVPSTTTTTSPLDAFDAWQALGTARVLARQWRPAGDAAQRAWQALEEAAAGAGAPAAQAAPSSSSPSSSSSPAAAAVQQRARQLMSLLRRVVGHLADGGGGGGGEGAEQQQQPSEAGAAQRLASAARAAAGAAALAGSEEDEGAAEAARLLAAELSRAAEAVRSKVVTGGGAAAEAQLEVVERVARALKGA